jgi:hypothetical protein
MVQECNEQFQTAKVGDGKPSIQSPLGDHQFARGVLKACASGSAGDAAMLQSHGFPTDVFTQKEPHQTPLEKQFRDREVSRLGDAEHKQYDKETAAQKAHQVDTMHGKRPDSPVHDKVDDAVKKAEEQAKQRAMDSMSPAQREQLKQEEQKYDREYGEYNHHGHGHSPLDKEPVKGKTMQEYDRLVQREANKDLRENK